MKKMNVKTKRSIAGILFISPWLAGIILFFLQAIVNLLRYSFVNFQLVQSKGYELKELTGGLFSNYTDAFLKDSLFPQKLTQSLSDMLYRVPIILVFSLFVAIVLNQKFKGRSLMRAIFFIPILISSGVIASIIKGGLTSTVVGTDSSNNIFNAALLTDLLFQFGMPETLVYQIGDLVANVTDLIWNSSVQIIVFLMGLLTIPETYYEVADVEGATGWEAFWKVTFPAVSPYILVNMIYTVIDHFINYDNSVMKYITETAFKNFKFSYASAMAWIYFIIIIVMLVLLVAITSLIIPFKEKQVKSKKRRIR